MCAPHKIDKRKTLASLAKAMERAAERAAEAYGRMTGAAMAWADAVDIASPDMPLCEVMFRRAYREARDEWRELDKASMEATDRWLAAQRKEGAGND